MLKQIESPKIISLFYLSLMALFRQINEAIQEIDGPIKDNLEKINGRYSGAKEKNLKALKITKKIWKKNK